MALSREVAREALDLGKGSIPRFAIPLAFQIGKWVGRQPQASQAGTVNNRNMCIVGFHG